MNREPWSRVGRAALALAASIWVGLAAAGPAAALSPPPAPSPAGIVFANGGRIASIEADGSGRTVLTNRSRTPRNGPYGHADPEVSPDGARMLFTETRRVRRWQQRSDVIVARPDGTGRVKLLTSGARFRYSAATWMPDGRILAPYFELAGKLRRTGLLTIRPDGSERRKLVELRPRPARAWKIPQVLGRPSVSPDGRTAIARIGDGHDFELAGDSPGRLEAIDLETGKRRLIAEEGFSGDWSPDGRSIVYARASRSDDDEVCSWSFSCERASRLVVADADGGSPRRLLPGRADQRAPSWSPDGGRILFQSNRNLPSGPEATELYSVRPDGGCLTWLTNGSPASVTPSWVPGPGSSEPGGCGRLPLAPTLELAPLERHPRTAFQPYWVGDSLGALARSGGGSYRVATLIEYVDCLAFRFAGACRRPFILWTIDLCPVGGPIADLFVGTKLTGVRRGVPIFRSRVEGGWVRFALVGRSFVAFLGGSKDAHREIDALRPVGGPPAEGLLPRPLFPRAELKLARKVARTVKRAGSARLAARRLGMKPRQVRVNLRMARHLSRIPRHGTVRCPKKPARPGERSSSAADVAGLAAVAAIGARG